MAVKKVTKDLGLLVSQLKVNSKIKVLTANVGKHLLQHLCLLKLTFQESAIYLNGAEFYWFEQTVRTGAFSGLEGGC